MPISIQAAIANYNQFPTLQPSHILDDKRINISFAFSMRVLESDYNGPIIRLRRASDNAEQDFGWGDNDIVDISAIDIWRNGANVFVHTWYDQSGLERDAVQTTIMRQPRFYPDTAKPYFQGDGNNDHLTVDTPNGIQDVTNNGKEGTVFTVLRATKRNQHTFGVLRLGNTINGHSNRWSSHTNWSNNNLYFDPGTCCTTNRNFLNSSNENKWAQYTLMKTPSHVIMRANSILKKTGTAYYDACTLIDDFAIGWATGDETGRHSTASFAELIMYKRDISATQYQKIEENSMKFWGI
jgi:hypothetical protein